MDSWSLCWTASTRYCTTLLQVLPVAVQPLMEACAAYVLENGALHDVNCQLSTLRAHSRPFAGSSRSAYWMLLAIRKAFESRTVPVLPDVREFFLWLSVKYSCLPVHDQVHAYLQWATRIALQACCCVRGVTKRQRPCKRGGP